jgi:molybdenum cofactor synthesis domain-containing protein
LRLWAADPRARVRSVDVTLEAKVLVVSDSVHAGAAEDRSGRAVSALLEQSGFRVVKRDVCPDGVVPVEAALRALVSGFEGLVVTTGGTGFSPRDLTPEATLRVIERQAPALAEAMHRCSPKARLSRGVAGTAGRSLVLNTPGSPQGAVECLDAVIDVVPHALALLSGENPHPHRTSEPPRSTP